MISNFFQKRFQKNIKFLARKHSLQQDYEFLYEGIELQEIFLTEIAIIKKLLLNEKNVKRDIIAQNEFDNYIKAIEEFYEQVESMDESEIVRNEERIKMIIAAAKLSLNSPSYFNVDINKLKVYDINYELTQFLRRKPLAQSNNISILIEFKQEIERKIENNQREIEKLHTKMTPYETELEALEKVYWVLHECGPMEFLGSVLNTNIIIKEEKKEFIKLVNNALQEQTPENIERINSSMAFMASLYRRKINTIKAEILIYEQQMSILKTLAQNINEYGQLKESISDELIEEYMKQLNHSELDKLQLQLQILKEQARIIKEQRIERNTQLVEQRIKKLATRVEQKDIPKEEKIIINLTEEQKQKIEIAKKIVTNELGENEPNENMIPDELEEIFVEELKKENLDEQTIEQIIKRDAGSNLCSLKFIVYGLNHQLENLNEQNIEKTLKLIVIYIKCYYEYKQKVEDERKRKLEQKKIIEEIEQNAQEIIDSCQKEKPNSLTEEQIQNLNAYIDVDIDKSDATDIEAIKVALSNVGLDLDFLSMYKAYNILNDTILETKLLLEMMRKEYKEEYKELIKQKIELIKELSKQFDDSKQIYDEKKDLNITSEKEKNEDKNIIIYLEIPEGTTQAEERIKEDICKYGIYTETDVNVLRDLIRFLKEETKDTIYKESDDIKPFDPKYKKRRIKKGNFRIAYIPLSSAVLGMNKNVYLVISAGKKISDSSDVYEDANRKKIKQAVLDFIEEYTKLQDKSEQEKQEFIKKHQAHERRMIDVATNERGELYATRRR